MTRHDDFDRTLAGWFEADALSPAPVGGLDRVLDATRRRNPRPAWLAGLGGHWVGEVPDGGSILAGRSLPGVGLRWSTALILLLVMTALVGGAILVGARLTQPSPLRFGRLGHLAYSLDGDIYVADWDGRNPVRIADRNRGGKSACPPGYSAPIWSPDGRYLAYRCRSASASEAFSIADGTVNISDPSGNVVASFPGVGDALSWSPDSTRVATWVDWGSTTIGVFGLDGMRQALLTVPPGCSLPGDLVPVWSPDGTSLTISPCVVPLDGRTPERAPADDPRSHPGAAYSRDGNRVAFNEDGFLVVAAADGTQRRLVAQVGLSPSDGSILWSPTGDRIAMTWGYGGYLGSVWVRVIDVASGSTREVWIAGRLVRLLGYSPDGDRVLFRTEDSRNVKSLWSVRTDGSDASPDGSAARQLVPVPDRADALEIAEGTDLGDWQWLPADR